jgi:hypothetical protein
MSERLEKVRAELAKYEHPLFEFETRAVGDEVEISIRLKTTAKDVHTYQLVLLPNEVDHRQFPWIFQKQLYDSLHDYIVEMFTRNPQMKQY